jgi:hypothetical protein
MKTIKLFILAAAGLAALAACNREGITPADDARAITIEAAIGEMTKVTTTGNTAAFDNGDKIALYAWTGDKTTVPATKVVNGVENTYDGTKWTPATQMLWADMISEHYFLGIYPAKAVTDFKADAYTLNPADYEGSDLLIATNLTGLKAQDNPVTLGFDHAMAKLQVSLNFRNQWDGTPAVNSVSATAAKTGTVDYLSKTVTAGAASSVDIPALATPADGYALSFSGLMIPQGGFRTLTINVAGSNYVFTHTADITLVAGKITVVNLVLGREGIELASAITISDWTGQGEAINGDIFKPEA